MRHSTRICFGVCLAAMLSSCGGSNQVPNVPHVTQARSTTSFSTSGVPSHVLTAIYGWGYSGVSTAISVSQQSPWVSWAYTNNLGPYQGAGIKTLAYVNFWRCAASDYPKRCYNDISPGGRYADAAAKNCSGAPVYDPNYGGAYQTSAYAANAVNVAEDQIGGSSHDAVVADDTMSSLGFSNGPICNYTLASWRTAQAAVLDTVAAAKSVNFFANAVNAWTDGTYVQNAGIAVASSVLGAVAEGCYIVRDSNAYMTGNLWASEENAEISVIRTYHKIFWCYVQNSASASSAQAMRMYGYASFLLTYDPSLAMYETAFATPYSFAVMPEVGFVPEGPLRTASSVSAYQSGGVYIRQFANCYYRGSLVGSCAVVVNPTTSSASFSLNYSNSMVLAGGGVCDTLNGGVCSGGSVSFNGPQVTSLGAHSAAILISPSGSPTPTPGPTSTPGPTPVPTPIGTPTPCDGQC